MSRHTESDNGAGAEERMKGQRRLKRHRLFLISLAFLVSAIMVSVVFTEQNNNPDSDVTYPVTGYGVTGLGYEYGSDVFVDGEKYALAYLYDEVTDTCKVAGWRGGQGYNNPRGNVVIPSTINVGGDDVDVKTIGEHAFDQCPLISVVIPEGVTKIETYAFAGCSLMTSVDIPSSVSSIGNGAFIYCAELTSAVIPYGVATIDADTFSGCDSLTSVDIPDSVISIEQAAFYRCTSLASVTIPGNIVTIGQSAFGECNQLTSINIPDSVTFIDDYVFSGCTALASINVSLGNQIYSSDGGVLYNLGKTKLILFPEGKAESTFVIPDNVTDIGINAFENCMKLTEVAISDDVVNIGMGAFKGCTGLTSVSIGNNVETIPIDAFEGCISLESIIIPDNVTTIDHRAFENCTNLSTVTLSNGIDKIQDNTFKGCIALETIEIPANVTTVGPNAFAGCTSLLSITVASGNTVYSSVDGYLCDEPGDKLLYCPTGMAGSLTVPSYFTAIGDSAFEGCTELESVTIPDNIIQIGDSTFRDCTGLTSVIIPDNIQKIMDGMFHGCTGFTHFEIPDHIQEIGESAFRECTGLESMIIPDEVTYVGKSAFRDCTGLTSVTILGKITNLEPSLFRDCTGLTTVIISEDILEIRDHAFSGCTGLTSVNMSDTVTIIGDFAFQNCKKLTSVALSDSLEEIGESAFRDCTGLTSVTIPDGVIYIGKSAFRECTGLTSATMLGEVASIGDYAFAGCNRLTSLTFWEVPASPVLGSNSFSLGTPDRPVTCTVYSFDDRRFLDSNEIRGFLTTFNYEQYTHRITFEMNGHGHQLEVQKVEIGDSSFNPGDPSETGYIFGGWFENPNLSGEAFVFGELVEGHITLYAKWIPIIYTVAFKSDGVIVQVSDLEYGSLIFAPSVIPTKAAKDGVEYEFMKWEDYWEGMTVTGDVTFVAIFYEWGGDTPAGSEDDPGEEFPILYAAVAVVAVIAISLVAVFVRRM